MTVIRADIGPTGRRILLRFQYDPVIINRVKTVPSARFVPRDRGGPAWAVPLNLKTITMLRERFADALVPTSRLRAEGTRLVREKKKLTRLANAEDADLHNVNPDIAGWLREYQRADVAFMARRSCINANEPGLGKTAEVVAATAEMGLGDGLHLVIAPISSHDPVWREEINRILPGAAVYTGETPAERIAMIEDSWQELCNDGGWVIVNPAMLQRSERFGHAIRGLTFGSITIDEFHDIGLRNPNSKFNKVLKALPSTRRWALSGTPMGGVPLNLWAVLRWIDPQAFGARWQWANQWLEVKSNGFGHNVGDLKPGRENEFYEHHAPWLIRRLKSEEIPDLPEKQHRVIWCRMNKRQRAQYEKFEQDAEITLSGKRIAGTSILAEYARLKQFAFGSCKVRDDVVVPTKNSPKLVTLVDRLKHHGVHLPGGEHAVVGSHMRRVCDLIGRHLDKEGFKVAVITGSTKKRDRDRIVKEFQSGKGARVVVVSTKAAGQSITLDIADSMHIMDETWNPDNQVQLEDRIHRGSRIHKTVIYRYMTRGTIDEDVANMNEIKAINNRNALDFRRKVLRARSRRRGR